MTHSEETNGKPVLLIIESDARVINALTEEIEGNFVGDIYSSLEGALKAYECGSLKPNPIAAIIEMKDTTKDELARFTRFFSQLPKIPIFLTLTYDSDFQLQEPYIKSWTKNVLFRPFDVDKLVQALYSLLD